jgi:hypothetical protein
MDQPFRVAGRRKRSAHYCRYMINFLSGGSRDALRKITIVRPRGGGFNRNCDAAVGKWHGSLLWLRPVFWTRRLDLLLANYVPADDDGAPTSKTGTLKSISIMDDIHKQATCIHIKVFLQYLPLNRALEGFLTTDNDDCDKQLPCIQSSMIFSSTGRAA